MGAGHFFDQDKKPFLNRKGNHIYKHGQFFEIVWYMISLMMFCILSETKTMRKKNHVFHVFWSQSD